MNRVHICSPAIWGVSDCRKTSVVLQHLRQWIPLLEGRSESVSPIPKDIDSGDFKSIWSNILKIMKASGDRFIQVVKNLSLRENTSELYYNNAITDAVILSEIMRLFISLEPDDTKWYLVFHREEAHNRFVASTLEVSVNSRQFKDITDFYDFYKEIENLSSK